MFEPKGVFNYSYPRESYLFFCLAIARKLYTGFGLINYPNCQKNVFKIQKPKKPTVSTVHTLVLDKNGTTILNT